MREKGDDGGGGSQSIEATNASNTTPIDALRGIRQHGIAQTKQKHHDFHLNRFHRPLAEGGRHLCYFKSAQGNIGFHRERKVSN